MSPRATRAAALFGLPPAAADDLHRRWRAGVLRSARSAAAAAEAVLAPGRVVLLTGPSGSGKSTAIELLSRRLRRAGRPVVRPPAGVPRRLAVADACAGRLEGWLGSLACAGLAEASLLARPVWALSTGERSRLLLACALERSRPGCVLVVDEFAGVLDRATALSVACAAARFCRRRRVSLVVSCCEADALEALAPDVVICMSLAGDRPSPPVVLAHAPAKESHAKRGAAAAV